MLFATWVLGLFALGAGALAAWKLLAAAWVPGEAVRVTGTVTGFKSTPSRSGYIYFPTMEASLPDGRKVQGISVLGKSWQSPPVGTAVPLFWTEAAGLQEIGGGRYLTGLVFLGLALFFGVMATTFWLAGQWSPIPR